MTWLMHGETPLTVTAVVNHDKPQIYPKADDDSTIVIDYPKAQAVGMGSRKRPFARKDVEVYGSRGYAIPIAAEGIRARHAHETEEQKTTAEPLLADASNSLRYLTRGPIWFTARERK